MFSAKFVIALLVTLTSLTDSTVARPAEGSISPDSASVADLNNTVAISALPIRSLLEARVPKEPFCYVWHGMKTISSKTVANYATSFQEIDPDHLHYIPPGMRKHGWYFEEAQVCVVNWYLFVSTRVSNKEIGQALQRILETCCQAESCRGGRQQGHGDSGLKVNIDVVNMHEECY